MYFKTIVGGLLILSGMSCGSGRSNKPDTDPKALKASMPGLATLVMLDFELIRPDHLIFENVPNDYIVINHINDSTFEYLFNSCPSANGGVITGTITVTKAGTDIVSYSSLYKLKSTNGSDEWIYAGSKLTTIDTVAKTAIVTSDSSLFPNVTYNQDGHSTPVISQYSPQFYADWSNLPIIHLGGSYLFTKHIYTIGNWEINAAISPNAPLVWNQSCGYPNSGLITMSEPSTLSEVRFSQSIADPGIPRGCGTMTINGIQLNLGQ